MVTQTDTYSNKELVCQRVPWSIVEMVGGDL